MQKLGQTVSSCQSPRIFAVRFLSTPPKPPPSTSVKHSRHDLQRLWTIPNVLSMSRIVSAPIIGWAVCSHRPVTALVLLAASGATDAMDGWIARKYGQTSILGSVLDPLGDKLLVGVLTLALYGVGQLPGWLVSVILGRDALLMMTAAFYRWRSLQRAGTSWRQFWNPKFSPTLVKPSLISKVNTAMQLGMIGIALVNWQIDTSLLHNFSFFLQLAVTATTSISALDYLLNYRRAIRHLRS